MQQLNESLPALSLSVKEMKRWVNNGDLDLLILNPVHFSTIELTKVRFGMPLTEIKKITVEI